MLTNNVKEPKFSQSQVPTNNICRAKMKPINIFTCMATFIELRHQRKYVN